MYPLCAQEERLRRLVDANKESAFGVAHHFHEMSSIQDYRNYVPIRDYDDMNPWVERIAGGEKNVLTSAPVRMVELSGGSTHTNKIIPYTEGLLEDFSAATNPWLYNLFVSCQPLRGTKSYWSISPVMRKERTTTGGVPIGFEDDVEYFSPIERWALKRLMAVPNSVARMPSLEAWRMATLRHLLESENLGLISVWSPTFLILLMEALENHLEELLKQIRPARAATIRQALGKCDGTVNGELIWPQLSVISCWTEGCARNFVPALRRFFPKTMIQPKGLLATEGVVSFPLWGRTGSVLAVAGHFMEFIDVEHPNETPLLAHELREGACYSPVLSTGGGFYRYHLKDIVRCVGRFHSTPLIQFIGKLDSVTDLCGEKLNSRQIEDALDLARKKSGIQYRFALVSPYSGESPHYRLYIESDADDSLLEKVVNIVEEYFSTGHHYQYCRQLGQLGPMRIIRVKNGWARFMNAMVAAGRRAGEIKPTELDVLGIAHDAFAPFHRDRIVAAAKEEPCL